MQLKLWTRSGQTILGNHQTVYLAQYSNIEELLANGRRNILVVAAHQDDEIIGMGGTMKLYSTGIDYEKNGQSKTFIEKNPRAFFRGGLGTYSMETISDLAQRMEKSGRRLILPPKDSSNIVVAYVTNGAKIEQTIESDLIQAHPEKTMEQILCEHEVASLHELTDKLNQSRYPETLAALSCVGATSVIFLEYPSSDLRLGPDNPANDLAVIIKLFKPETIFTLSPFEFSHSSHILVSDLTVNAARLVQNPDYSPSLKGYPVWDPDKLIHREIVDISEVWRYKLDSLHLHSIFGSQGNYGRRYEVTRVLNELHAITSTSAYDHFNASMQRPRLPANVMSVEIFTDMNPLLKNKDMTLKHFVEKHFQETLRNYPIK